MSNHFDVIVVGGGPAGYASALYGAAAGLNIALIEKSKLGGTCLNVGCIPAKELLETAAVFRTVRHAAAFGVNASEPTIDFAVTQVRKQGVVDTLVKGLAGLLKHRKVTVFDGMGVVSSTGDVKAVNISGGESGDVSITSDNLILAAGSVPRTIPGFDVDGTSIVTSDELLSIQSLPKRAAVIGGGAIGIEFASMMADLGTEVTVLEAMPKIIPGIDPDAAKVVQRSLKKRGVTIRTGVMVSGHQDVDGAKRVTFGEDESVDVDLIVLSIGRRPFTDLLGLDAVGVPIDDRGFISVDEACRTPVPGVWAVGDIIATAQLAHIGFAEGMVAIRGVLGEDPQPVDYMNVPWCIYCHPEVAFAGHTEESAKDAGFDVVTSTHRFAGNGRAMIIGETEGLVKVIAEKGSDGRAGRMLGVHMVGPWVTEQLGQGYMAINWEATVDEVAAFIQPHPSMSELYGETVMALTGRGLHG
ncbi:MAG: dihydrolipoamide dehydrogenase [Verrucomicrobiales bacterium]|jgi:dihydrolipoamide dehydrogenase